MNNFTINPNFNTLNYDKSFNNIDTSFSNANENLNSINQDKNSFFSIMNNMNTPLQAGVEHSEGMAKTKELSATAKVAQDIGSGFFNSIQELSASEKRAEDDFETFASGGNISVHEVMISAQKSSLAMQMAIQLRNQMLNAYNEFKSMSI